MKPLEASNCVEHFLIQANLNPSGFALRILGDRSVSFGELLSISIRMQDYFKIKGLEAGNSVLIFDRLSIPLYASIIALMGLGARVVFVEPWMPIHKIAIAVNLTRPKVFLCGLWGQLWGARVSEIRNIPKWLKLSKLLESLSPPSRSSLWIEKVHPDTCAMVAFSSGTTGNPKGVVRSHGYLLKQKEVLARHLVKPLAKSSEGTGTDLCIFANFVLLNLSLGRGSILVPHPWRARDIQCLRDLPDSEKPTTMTVGPSFLERMILWSDLKSLDSIHVGGALTDCQLFKAGFKKWPNADWHHVYGSSEVEPVCVSDARVAVEKSEGHGFFQTLYLGHPVPELQTQLSAEGLKEGLWVAGPHVCAEYLGNIEETRSFKHRDENNVLWHFMGDRMKVLGESSQGTPGEWWYWGRAHQLQEDFELEQKIYSHLGSSKSFLSREEQELILCGEGLSSRRTNVLEKFPMINDVQEQKIVRDRRHQARIDRQRSFSWIIRFRALKDRIQIPSFLLITGGLVFSAAIFSEISLEILLKNRITVITGWFGLLLFFIELRLMDEIKDYEKDKIAHPDRPLPKGLLSSGEVTAAIWILLAGMSIFSALIQSWIYFFIIVYLYLMYKEFFLGKSLESRPFLYGISHQLILLPLCLFPVSLMMSPETLPLRSGFTFGMLILGSFFSYEIGRKLNPKTHPILLTYLQVSGKEKTIGALVFLQLLCMGMAYGLNTHHLLWPCQTLFLLIVGLYFYDSRRFKFVENFAAISLLIHIWSGPLQLYFRGHL